MGSPFKFIFFPFVLLAFTIHTYAQHYQALQGSMYAGSLAVGNNPSSIVHTPYPWDVTLLGFQTKYTTNALTIYKYSLLKSAANSEYLFDEGYRQRYGMYNLNINLLNARIALNRKHAIAFGANLRGYGNLTTSDYYFIDTLKTLNHFLKINKPGDAYSLKLKSSNWIELFATYARTVFDNETERLNAGITVKAMRGITGALFQLNSSFAQGHSTPPGFEILEPTATYSYSSNFDTWKNGKSSSENLNDFVSRSEGGLSADLGAELVIKSAAAPGLHEDDGYYDYDWKVGVALLDIGFNTYKSGSGSRIVSGLSQPVSDSLLGKKLSRIKSFRVLNDSLSSIAQLHTPGRDFKIINPLRLIVNVDRYLFGDYYINAELSINLASVSGKNRNYVNDVNLLNVTPRWETRRWGVYLPFSYNTQKKLWFGGAFKAGPLLLGIHNWANIFSSTKMQNGGGYIALVIRPGHNTLSRGDKRYECPPGLKY